MRTVTLLLFIAIPASAQNLYPTFSLTGGAYGARYSTDVRVDPEFAGGTGTELNVERDLGLSDAETMPRFTLQWQPFRRHELGASHFSASRRGFRAIREGIQFGDRFYPIETDVTSRVDLDYWDATYTLWVVRRDRSGFGLMIGAAGLAVDAELSAQAPGQSVKVTEKAKTEVPIALGGAQYRFAITPRIHGEVRGAVLPRVEIDVYSGRALSASGRIEYAVTRFVGIGAAYHFFDLDGTVADPQFAGALDLEIRGAEVYLRLALGR